jgi:hypothetical protein
MRGLNIYDVTLKISIGFVLFLLTNTMSCRSYKLFTEDTVGQITFRKRLATKS